MDRLTSTCSIIQRWTIVLVALLAPALTGGTQRWAQGVVLVLLACAVLLKPPSLFAGTCFSALCIGSLALGATAWLPRGFAGETWWRRILEGELGMTLPGT